MFLQDGNQGGQGGLGFQDGHAGFEVGSAVTFAAAIVAIALVRTRPEVVREHIAELAA